MARLHCSEKRYHGICGRSDAADVVSDCPSSPSIRGRPSFRRLLSSELTPTSLRSAQLLVGFCSQGNSRARGNSYHQNIPRYRDPLESSWLSKRSRPSCRCSLLSTKSPIFSALLAKL